MTISDISPRLALKRILLLYENGQYREAANFINRLGHPTFRTVLGQLPVDLFVEAMPHSVSILEALYAKVFLSSDCSVKWLKPGGLVLKLVRLLCAGPPDGWTLGAKKLLKVIVLTEPALKKGLRARRRALDKAVEGLGKHGLVGTSDESLCSLHEALKVQFRNLVEAYRGALHKLEELSLVKGQGGGAPVQASHQRQLSLRQGDVQERLIKNKSLLNAVEAATADRSLAVLLAILERRVEADKEALFQFTQVKKEIMPGTEPEDTVVAPLLMRYSHACHQVTQIFQYP
ncbi:hypothetical protein AAG570_010001 [Ranatra chinensis]|uniref:Uncharacterized protein n=1 Tax=Ranatra chinensis TaxID=642074 RepID=A0ABD0Z7U3_9HEMI